MKANEALIEEQDNRGGYLVEPEVAAAILRIAASVGTIMKQCQKWPMKTDELGIPNYTGSFLTGSYVGVDLPGTVTGFTFGQAVLIARSGSSRSRSATTSWPMPRCSSLTGSSRWQAKRSRT